MLSLLFKVKKQPSTLEDSVMRIQQGDIELQNELILQYKPFILKSVSSVCKRYIHERDDEFSIGLIAFNEAIEQYSVEKGSSLLSFAQLLIKRRVIDYIRKESKHSFLPMDHSVEANTESQHVAEVSLNMYTKEMELIERKEEITHFNEMLKEFSLTFDDIVKHSPKHQDTRENMINIAQIAVTDETIRKKLFEKKKLPIKDLLNKVNVSKKTLERNRKYIISMAIILSGDYVFLKEYLKGVIE